MCCDIVEKVKILRITEYLIMRRLTDADKVNRLNKIKQIAHDNGGFCMSDQYIDGTSPLLFECKNKHQWYGQGNNVFFNGHWCKRCAVDATANKQKAGINAAKTLALSRGGKCLADKYI